MVLLTLPDQGYVLLDCIYQDNDTAHVTCIKDEVRVIAMRYVASQIRYLCSVSIMND